MATKLRLLWDFASILLARFYSGPSPSTQGSLFRQLFLAVPRGCKHQRRASNEAFVSYGLITLTSLCKFSFHISSGSETDSWPTDQHQPPLSHRSSCPPRSSRRRCSTHGHHWVHPRYVVICLILVMAFEAPMYPVTFVLRTTGLSRHTRRASGLLVLDVCGAVL